MKINQLFIIIFFFSVSCTSAQDIKIGYINLDLVFAKMPEMEVVNKNINEYQAELDKNFNAKNTVFQDKLKLFQDNGETMDAVLKTDAEKELQDLQAQIVEFRDNANQALTGKRGELLNPIRVKVKDAIEQYAKKNAYTHVFSTDGSLVYVKDEESNISSEIAASLGFSIEEK